MAALGCPGDMAAVVGAVEQMGEYVQVVVGADGEQVMVVEEGGGVPELSPEILHSLSQSETVYYVQPDGSLVAGGRLETGGHIVEAAQSEVRIVTGGHGMEADHSEMRLVTGGHGVEADQSEVRLVTEHHGMEADHSEMRLVTGGHGMEADQSEVRLVTGGHGMEADQSEVRLVTGGHGMEADHSEVRLVTGGHGVEADQSEVRLVTEHHGMEADQSEMRLVTEHHGMEADQSEVRLVTGGHGMEADQSEVRLVTGGHGMEADQSEMRLVTGGHGMEADQSEMRLVTGGHGMEADQSEVRLVTGDHGMEADQSEMRLVTGGHGMEADQSEMRLVTGGHGMEADQSETGVQVEETVESGGHAMSFVQGAVNLVTRGQMGATAHPGIEEIVHNAVNLVTGGQVVEAAQSEINLVNGGQIEEAVHSGVSWVNGGLAEEDDHHDMGTVTALNLTKEAAQRSAPQAGVSQGPAGVQDTVPGQPLPAIRVTTNSGRPTFPSSDVAQQLKTVAHHVALREGDTLARILSHKELKSFRVQVPGLQGKKSADPVVLNLSTVHMKNAGASLLGTQVVHFKSLSGSGSPLVVNASSLESPIQILVRQTQLSAAKPRTPDPNKNTSESLEEHRSCVAHPQNGARASCTGDPVQKKGHKRKKPIKIKTRSGRISRPPKHKAKDYKFLKVGDMIQGSTSDSEDFSELSTDEDEKGAKEMTPCELPPCPVRNALFQCQTCEKSYMGKGGLSRHYRLYPSHGQMEAQFVSDAKKKGESGVGGHSLPSEPKKPTPRPRKRLLEDPLHPDPPSLPSLVTDGFEFVPVSATCRGRQGRKFGRPRKILSIASSEHNALTAKEHIQQCEDADLKEHVAPSFTERLSVYDFLLLKVRQEHPDKPVFPLLYKELENLHSMIRVLAQEYFSNGAGKTLEVADCKVAASLGISAEKIVEVSPPVTSSMKDEQRIQSEVASNECPAEELMPPPKRFRLDEPESESPTKDLTTGSAPDRPEEQQRADLVSVGDESLCGNDTSFEDTINCTEEVAENVMEEEVDHLHLMTAPESVPCDGEQSLVESSPPPLTTSPELGDPTQISSDRPEETSSDAIQTDVIHEDTDQLPCPQASAADPALPSDAPPTTSDGFLSVDTLMPPFAGEQCTDAFSFHHGQDLVFVHSSEEAAAGEAVVIYDSGESPADTQMDTVVALVEKQ